MTRIFIGGSRRVSRLTPSVIARLETITAKGLSVIVGDANGADKAVQHYFYGKKYDLVEVFCSGNLCRNNIGNWRTRHVAAASGERGFQFYAAKDREMAREADYGFMIWDGKSTGTLLNVVRLLRWGKKVVVYSAPDQNFAELRGYDQWEEFIGHYSAVVRNETEQKVALEERSFGGNEQFGSVRPRALLI